jgi:hypothetical protein
MKMAAVLSQRSSCHQYNPFSSWVVRLRRMPSFARRFAQNPLQISQHSAMRLWSGKTWGEALMETKKGLDPVTDSARGRLGSGEGDRLVLLHFLLLLDITL